LHQLKVEMKKS